MLERLFFNSFLIYDTFGFGAYCHIVIKFRCTPDDINFVVETSVEYDNNGVWFEGRQRWKNMENWTNKPMRMINGT